MGAFIANFQPPFTLADLWECYETSGATNIDYLLDFPSTPGEWSVHRNATIGDRVFFMCAVTSISHIGHVCAEARRGAPEEILAFAEEQRELYRTFAGHIVAVGRVAGEPFQADDPNASGTPSRNPWFARIGELQLLGKPISIDDFRDFVKVSRTGSITKLDEAQASALEELVAGADPGEKQEGWYPKYWAITRFTGTLANDPGHWAIQRFEDNPDSDSSSEESSSREIFVPSELTLAFLKSFLDAGLYIPNNIEVLRDNGIPLSPSESESILGLEKDPTQDSVSDPNAFGEDGEDATIMYSIDTTPEMALVFISYALEENHLFDGSYEAMVSGGFIDECLRWLERADKDDYRELLLPKHIKTLASTVLDVVSEMPDDGISTVGECISTACEHTGVRSMLGADVVNDVWFLVFRHAKERGLMLDFGDITVEEAAEPFSLSFRVEHLK